MDIADEEPRARIRPAAALVQLPTGAKVFLYLILCLLPLALIALFTTLQSTRNADTEARARLGAAASESSGVLRDILVNHVSQLADALAALEANPHDVPACTRLAGTFATTAGARFSIADGEGRVICGQRFRAEDRERLQHRQVRTTLEADGMTLRIGGRTGSTATAFYSKATLAAVAQPSGFVPEYGAALIQRGDRLVLRKLEGAGPLDRRETIPSNLGIDGLELEMSMLGTPITSPMIINTVVLVLMWIAAAGISWFVVDILLIRPLRRLRASVGAYKPGEVIDIERFGDMPAAEIRELGDTFRDISRTVKEHEADLAEGLVRQTKLTREVHHRVKNNLQVIASLINFHARSARSEEASEAYASIQRRVDALAVVHRHHYAELEENRGLDLRSVIGELAANIRATAPERAQGLGVTLDVSPVLVNQDVAIAVAFLLTEIVELAMNCNPSAQIRISIKPIDDDERRALLRVSSPALVESPVIETLVENRYGRVIGGLARQLRTKLHHDPLSGAYEAAIAITGRP
ncbi:MULTISPECIES: sensor histidine kinase [Sphingomonas]|uniref:histidine kinase n=1 Tax=Sphingomonas leidyi TaxID=68569 RepID=A0A7X5ZWM2_9SPHN|nr:MULTISPECIES: histidine kinase dimerization/phosphoacceptor domain -containing protein [Sphingomonas]MBN8810993.1 histidine kinase [Sphingomonas sp.]NIJ66296.1 two-component sensor histidine kinase [Sphingomonas leidyi]OJY54494.1 MAG: histidine kinase [Sphingomonas sp. 67-41]